MARVDRSKTMLWDDARALLDGFHRGNQELHLVGANSALSAAKSKLSDAQQHIQSAAAAFDEIELLEVADVCKTANARLGPAVKLINTVMTALVLGPMRNRNPVTIPWAEAQQRLYDFNPQDQKRKAQQIDTDLTRLSEVLAEAVDKVNAANSTLGEVDLLDVAEAGKVAAALLGNYRAVTALIGHITAAKYGGSSTVDVAFAEFEQLLEHEYHELALEDDYPAEAEAFAELDEVLDRMREIRLAPRIASRNLCAVAGGFSSGKSSFLNALIGGTEELLPTRITPTTSIPTFIFNIKDADQSINVFNHNGGNVQVEPEMLQQMTHDFKREYGIELKRLVDRVSINTPQLDAYPNVALVDTPGYTNPDEADGATSDREIALRAIWQSRFLIWLVDCEQGTLPEQDVDLIKRFLGQQAETSAGDSIYLILNKADKKPEEQRTSILEHVAGMAENHEISFFGIALYSAHSNEWYECEGRPFDEFLTVVNKAETLAIDALQDKVEAVFSLYGKHYRKELKEAESILGLMNRLSLGLEAEQESLESSLTSHQRRLKKTIREYTQWMEKAAFLQGKFRHSLRGFVEGVEAMRGKEDATVA